MKYTFRLDFVEFADRSEQYADMLQSRFREVRLGPDEQAFFAAYPDTLHFLAIVAEDTPDTMAVLPVLARIAQAGPRFDLRIVPDEYVEPSDYEAVLNGMDLDGDIDDLELPLLLVFDEEWQFQDHWGPHPEAAAAYIDGWLERHPEYEALADEESAAAQERHADLLHQLTHEMRCWYNSDLAAACAAEIRALLSRLTTDRDDDVGGEESPAKVGDTDRNTTKD